MARIPTAANVAQAPSLRDPGVSVPAVGQEVARGIAGVGTGLTQIAEKQQLAEDRRFLADFDSEVRTRAAEAVLQFEGQQESSTYAAQVEQAVQQIGPSVFKEFESRGYTPSQDARARAEVGFTGLLTNTRVSAITDQHNAKVAAALRGIQNNADVQLNLLVDRPSRENLAAVRESLQETFDQAEGMANPDVLARMRDKYQGEAFKSYVGGLIGQGRLGEARRELASDEANDLLDPNDKLRLRNELEREGRAYVARASRDVADTFRGFEVVVGEGVPPSTEMIERAQAQVDSLPPGVRELAQLQLDSYVAVGKRNVAIFHLPPEAQVALQREMQTALRRGATPEAIAQAKIVDGIIERSNEQRQYDATVIAVGAGLADPPPEGSTTNQEERRRYLREVSTATVELLGPDNQVLPREDYDRIERALKVGTQSEIEAAVDDLRALGLAARSATLGQLGGTVNPPTRLAIDVAGYDRQLAVDLIAAGQQKVSGGETSNAELKVQLDSYVGEAFQGYEGRYDDTLAAAKALYAKDVTAGRASETDAIQGVKAAFKRITAGRIVDINGGSALLPPNLTDRSWHPTQRMVEDRLPSLDTLERQQMVVRPVVSSSLVSLPPGAKFEGLFYAGTETPVPWEEFSSAPLGPATAPGVYPPQVNGGPVVGQFRYEIDGVPYTDRFVAAVDLNAVVRLAPIPGLTVTPERMEDLAAPGVERLQRGFEAPGARRGVE